MLVAWLSSFIIGCILAKLGVSLAGSFDRLPVFTMLAAATVVAVGHRAPASRGVSLRHILLVCCGLLWGLAHAAPTPSASVSDARIAKANGPFRANTTVLVTTPSGAYEAYGPPRVGATGALRVAPRSGLFTDHGARFAVRYAPPLPEPSLWLRLSESLRARLMAGAARFPWFDRQWLRGIVAGDRTGFDTEVDEAFRRTGMFHLLVVSGQHVTLVALMLGALVAAPLRALYALRLIAPRHWPAFDGALAISACLIGFLYAAATGMSVASQRAAMTFAVLKLLHAFATWLPMRERLLIAAALQSLAFPIGFLGEANLMSWGATLLVLVRRPDESAVWLQTRLTVLAAALFGQITLLAVPGNLLFVPVFSVLLAAGFLLCLWPDAPLAPLVLATQRSFADLVVGFGRLCDAAPWLAPPPEAVPGWARAGLAAAAGLILLNVGRNLSIGEVDPGPKDRGNA